MKNGEWRRRRIVVRILVRSWMLDVGCWTFAHFDRMSRRLRLRVKRPSSNLALLRSPFPVLRSPFFVSDSLIPDPCSLFSIAPRRRLRLGVQRCSGQLLAERRDFVGELD